LEDSLGGNTRTVILATITMLSRDAEVTESTLKFADRARRVMVRVKPNQMVDDKALLRDARKEIERLNDRVNQLEICLSTNNVDIPTSLNSKQRSKKESMEEALSIVGGKENIIYIYIYLLFVFFFFGSI